MFFWVCCAGFGLPSDWLGLGIGFYYFAVAVISYCVLMRFSCICLAHHFCDPADFRVGSFIRERWDRTNRMLISRKGSLKDVIRLWMCSHSCRLHVCYQRVNESESFAKATVGLSCVLRLHCGQLSLVSNNNLQALEAHSQATPSHVS